MIIKIRDILIVNLIEENSYVVDYGCGYGHILDIINATRKPKYLCGIELDSAKIGDAEVHIINGDVNTFPPLYADAGIFCKSLGYVGHDYLTKILDRVVIIFQSKKHEKEIFINSKDRYHIKRMYGSIYGHWFKYRWYLRWFIKDVIYRLEIK